jgi:hypothetical protein
VRKLTLILKSSPGAEGRLPYQVIHDMPNIRSLVVIHAREDTAEHIGLLNAIGKLPHLEDVTLRELDFNPHFNRLPLSSVDVSQTFFHHLLQTILKVHAEQLHSLHLYTLLPLHPDTYTKIRDQASNLRSVTFTSNIHVTLQDLFVLPVPWASGRTGSLSQLTLHNCQGVHIGRFMQNLIGGVYGTHLTDVEMIACGADNDLPYVPPASTPVCVSVDRLKVHHIFAWEISAIPLIPIQDLSLTRMDPAAFAKLPIFLRSGLPESDGTQVGFLGLKHIRLRPRVSSVEAFPEGIKIAYEELIEICQRRGIQCSWDAEDRVECRCHDII